MISNTETEPYEVPQELRERYADVDNDTVHRWTRAFLVSNPTASKGALADELHRRRLERAAELVYDADAIAAGVRKAEAFYRPPVCDCCGQVLLHKSALCSACRQAADVIKVLTDPDRLHTVARFLGVALPDVLTSRTSTVEETG